MKLQAAWTYIGPICLAAAPAWFVFDTLAGPGYAVPWWVAGPAAAGMELTGISAFHTATRFRSWNTSKRKSDPVAPLHLALAAVTIYVVAGCILTAYVKGDWTLALFFFLAATGYLTIGLNSDQDARESSVAEAKAEARKERKAKKQERERSPERPLNNDRPFERSPELDGLLATVAEHSGASVFGQADVQEWTGRKRTTAYQVIGYGEQSGDVQRVGRGKYKFVNGAVNDGS